MDFLSIRKKARERGEAKEAASGEAASAEPTASVPEVEPERPPERERRLHERRAHPSAQREGRRSRGDEPILTETDLVEGALQARLQGLEPSADGRFATWRPGSGPPPVEPDGRTYEGERARVLEEPSSPPAPAPARDEPPGRAVVREERPRDPLDEFFYRPDEESAVVPALGAPMVEEPAPAAPTAIDEFLTFLLEKEEFAVPIERVREVLRAPSITEVPRAPAHVTGVVTVRGEVVPVIDARSRLGLTRASGAQARIVIVDAGEGPLGLLVDEVASVVRLPRGSIEPCPQGISAAASDCVTGIGRWRDRLFMVVDVAMLIGRARAQEAR